MRFFCFGFFVVLCNPYLDSEFEAKTSLIFLMKLNTVITFLSKSEDSISTFYLIALLSIATISLCLQCTEFKMMLSPLFQTAHILQYKKLLIFQTVRILKNCCYFKQRLLYISCYYFKQHIS